MDIYRKRPIPAIYTELNFVRASKEHVLRDHPDNRSYLQRIQRVAAGQDCVSTLGTLYQLTIKASFPDDILERNCTTWSQIKWRYYYWKLWDAETLIVERELPTEAISLEGTGINRVFLNSIAQPKSCLPWLRTAQDALNSGDYQGYEISNNTAAKIEQYEKSLIARLKLNNIK